MPVSSLQPSTARLSRLPGTATDCSTPALPFRAWVAVGLARLAMTLLRFSGKGAGTSLPGKMARRLDPAILGHLSAQIRGLRLGITGTNGKTTTCGLLAEALRQVGQRVVHNQLGANMTPGITAALMEQTSWTGRLTADNAVLEVDEASLRHLTREMPLDAVVVTNLFRDQLDRYGELDTTARWIVEGAGPMMPLILNADDPLVAHMADGHAGPVYSFGVQSLQGLSDLFTPTLNDDAIVGFAQEVTQCPRCGARLRYAHTLYGHLGHYACHTCDFQRTDPTICAADVVSSPSGSSFQLVLPDHAPVTLQLPLPGLFNVYNALAALTTAWLAGVSPDCFQQTLDHLPSVFGRAEQRLILGRAAWVMLIKNPVGATEVLRCVAADPKARLWMALNDGEADGRDVSWIWDAAFELIEPTQTVVVSGQRAWDLAVRLKYAGLPEHQILVEPDLVASLRLAAQQTEPTQTLYLLPTYTVLLNLRHLWTQV